METSQDLGLYFNLKILNILENQTFDINSEKNIEINTFLEENDINNSVYFILNKEENNLYLLKNHISLAEEHILISCIKKSSHKYELFKIIPMEIDLSLNILNSIIWKALYYMLNNNEIYYLKENDCINIGCLNYFVKEIHISSKLENDSEKKHSSFFNLSPTYIKKEECPICKESLIKLCQCDEYEHFSFINLLNIGYPISYDIL